MNTNKSLRWDSCLCVCIRGWPFSLGKTSAQNPDEGDHAAGLFAIATVRKEPLGLARGTVAECVDATRRDASANQLLAIDGGEIDAARTGKPEPPGYVVAYFIAARADPWADRDRYLLCRSAEIRAHGVKRSTDDALLGSTPPGVDGRDGAVLGIGQKDWKTVGRANGESDARTICNQRVTLARATRTARDETSRGVDLLQAGHPV